MAGRNLFSTEEPAQTETSSSSVGRNLFAAPAAPVAPAAPTAPVAPAAPTGLGLTDLFEDYRAGKLEGSRRAATEELIRRSLTRLKDLPEAKEPEQEAPGILKRTASLAGDMALNMPASVLKAANDFGKALLSPIDTANAMGSVALGAVQKAIPGEQRAEASFDALAQGFKDKYGSLENLNTTLATDPASVLLDLSAVMTGGGTAMAKVPALAKTGEAVARAGVAVDPLRMLGVGATKTIEGAGSAGAQLVGALTGEGAQVVKQATKGTGLTSKSSPFVAGMRGKVDPDNLLFATHDALRTIKEQRGVKYRQQLAEIKGDTTAIDARPIKSYLQNLMGPERYNITVTPKGKLDFSRSTIQKSERANVAEIVEDVSKWGSRQGDNTAIGLDTLKKKLDNFYSENANTRAFVASLRDKVKDTIVRQVPKYAEMTKDYEQVTRLTKEMERSLALGKTAQMDTTMKKLTSTVKEDFGFRRALLNEIEAVSGRNLADEIAGLSMQGLVPKRLTGRIAAGGSMVGAQMASPWLLSIAALTSPRVMGEFLNAFGVGKSQVKKAVGVLKRTGAFNPVPRQTMAITGRNIDQSEEGVE